MRTAATTASRIARRGYLPQRNERLNCQQAVAMYSTISKTMCITASYFLRNRSITHQAVGEKELAAEKSITQPLCKSLYSLDRQTFLLSLIEASDHVSTNLVLLNRCGRYRTRTESENDNQNNGRSSILGCH